MRGAYAIARHEFRRRWPLILVGLAMGSVVLGFSGPDEQGLTQFADMLVTISVVVCWLIAFTTGMSLVGRPLHNGQLSFYFTRPITSAGIAIGKIVGGLAAIMCMHIALVVPIACAFVGRPAQDSLAGAAIFVGLAFFAVGLVIGILARSRSRWFVADVGGAAVAALVAVGMFAGFGTRKLQIAQFMNFDQADAMMKRADALMYALVVAAAIALVVSVVVAVARGRTDRELVHRGISVTLWPSLIAIGLVGLGLARWGLQ